MCVRSRERSVGKESSKALQKSHSRRDSSPTTKRTPNGKVENGDFLDSGKEREDVLVRLQDLQIQKVSQSCIFPRYLSNSLSHIYASLSKSETQSFEQRYRVSNLSLSLSINISLSLSLSLSTRARSPSLFLSRDTDPLCPFFAREHETRGGQRRGRSAFTRSSPFFRI